MKYEHKTGFQLETAGVTALLCLCIIFSRNLEMNDQRVHIIVQGIYLIYRSVLITLIYKQRNQNMYYSLFSFSWAVESALIVFLIYLCVTLISYVNQVFLLCGAVISCLAIRLIVYFHIIKKLNQIS